jgi:hypothetical protein
MQDYSIDRALSLLTQHSVPVLAWLLALPVLTFLFGRAFRKASPRAAALFATVPTHLAVLQGVSVLLVLAYSVLILHTNLLKLNIIVYYLPLASSLATLVFSSKTASFDEQPGFNRLSDLSLMAGLAFSLLFVLDRMNFFAGVVVLVPLAALGGVFVALNALFGRISGRSEGPDAGNP